MNKISDDILCKVEKPSRYVGGELNSFVKDAKKVDIRFAFCFPDVYEVGMSHLGMKILYYVLNNREDTYCERVFAPWSDMEALMRENDIPLFTLETKDALTNFDFIGFTLQYEMSYTNILNMLSLSNIPLRASERSEKDPIVIMGGPCASNPEPLHDIADLFCIGEGEIQLNEVMDLYKKMKLEGKTKKEFFRKVCHIDGIYVPSLYEVTYKEDNTIKEFKPKFDDVPKKVKRVIIENLNDAEYPDKLVVPYLEIVHDRIMLETMRGCSRGCRFCQAGIIYRPVREKTRDVLLEQAQTLLNSTGYDEISLASLSICDYSDIRNLVMNLIEKYSEKNVGVALPSLRIDSFSVDLLNEIQKVRKTGLTFAPEAGSQRMRDVINKGVSEEDLLTSVTDAFTAGWSTIKLYFMIGLPYETIEDVQGIAHLGHKVVDQYFKVPKEVRKKGLRVTLSSAVFVPKPFTPFQWSPMDNVESIRDKIGALRREIKSKAINYNWHESYMSFLEAVIARGDRRICDLLIKTFEKGAKLESWTEHFKEDIWKEAFLECNIDGAFYALRDRSYDEVFPWDFIDMGISKEFLINENEKAKQAVLTKDCRLGCAACGIDKNFMKGECFKNAISS